MSKTRTEVKEESRKRGIAATAAAVATGAVTVASGGLVPLGVVGIGATGALTYRWWKHRAKNGIKF